MVWESKCSTIAMLTNLEEDRRVSGHWEYKYSRESTGKKNLRTNWGMLAVAQNAQHAAWILIVSPKKAK